MTNAFGSDDIEEWIDNLDDDDVDYFYNLLVNGQLGDIMEAFRFENDNDDYGELNDYDDDDDDEHYFLYEQMMAPMPSETNPVEPVEPQEKGTKVDGFSEEDAIAIAVHCKKSFQELCTTDEECCQTADAAAIKADKTLQVSCREEKIYFRKRNRCLPQCRTTDEQCAEHNDCCSKICATTKKAFLKGSMFTIC